MPSSRSANPTFPSSDREPGPGRSAAALAYKLLLSPVLVAQAIRTRRRALVLPEAGGPRTGLLGDADALALRVLIAGDSSAAGVGVAHQDAAVAGHLVRALHRGTGRPVAWSLRAKSGLTTRGVQALLEAEPPGAGDVAIVISGVNDVVDQIAARSAVRHRAALADWLLDGGFARHVVFAPLPPIHRFPLLPEPLRRVLGADAQRHDAALARWAAGRHDVSHASFELDLSSEGMASDGFHPGEPVYRACGEALAAHVKEMIAEGRTGLSSPDR